MELLQEMKKRTKFYQKQIKNDDNTSIRKGQKKKSNTGREIKRIILQHYEHYYVMKYVFPSVYHRKKQKNIYIVRITYIGAYFGTLGTFFKMLLYTSTSIT